MAIQSITTLPALAVTVGSAQLRGEIVLGPSWPDSQGYIYNEGEHEDMWEARSYYFSTLTKNSDHLLLHAHPEEFYEGAGAFVISNPIDLAQYSALKVSWEHESNGWDPAAAISLVVSSVKEGNAWGSPFDARFYSSYGTWSRRTNALDISSLSGDYYIRVHIFGAGGMLPEWFWLRVYKIWLE